MQGLLLKKGKKIAHTERTRNSVSFCERNEKELITRFNKIDSNILIVN